MHFQTGGLTDSGEYSSLVDIYNATSNEWSTATLSAPRKVQGSTSACGKVFFAPGAFTLVVYISPVFCTSSILEKLNDLQESHRMLWIFMILRIDHGVL